MDSAAENTLHFHQVDETVEESVPILKVIDVTSADPTRTSVL